MQRFSPTVLSVSADNYPECNDSILDHFIALVVLYIENLDQTILKEILDMWHIIFVPRLHREVVIFDDGEQVHMGKITLYRCNVTTTQNGLHICKKNGTGITLIEVFSDDRVKYAIPGFEGDIFHFLFSNAKSNGLCRWFSVVDFINMNRKILTDTVVVNETIYYCDSDFIDRILESLSNYEESMKIYGHNAKDDNFKNLWNYGIIPYITMDMDFDFDVPNTTYMNCEFSGITYKPHGPLYFCHSLVKDFLIAQKDNLCRKCIEKWTDWKTHLFVNKEAIDYTIKSQ